MNQSKKLALSKETLRCLDDQDLTEVVGGWQRPGPGGNSNDCHNSNAFICVSDECVNSNALICIG
jgi:hypothetical protein